MADKHESLPGSGTLGRRTPTAVPFELPSRYGRDRARLFLVDPHLVHFYWEVADATLARAEGRKGELGVRLVRLDGGERAVAMEANVPVAMNWYWPAEPLA